MGLVEPFRYKKGRLTPDPSLNQAAIKGPGCKRTGRDHHDNPVMAE
jgi:hypothetical protein